MSSRSQSCPPRLQSCPLVEIVDPFSTGHPRTKDALCGLNAVLKELIGQYRDNTGLPLLVSSLQTLASSVVLTDHGTYNEDLCVLDTAILHFKSMCPEVATDGVKDANTVRDGLIHSLNGVRVILFKPL